MSPGTGQEPSEAVSAIDGESTRQMLELIDRIQDRNQGELDDAAIMAISDACCVSPEYVRVTANRVQQGRRQDLKHKLKSISLALDPQDRRFVMSGLLGSTCALMTVLQAVTGDQYAVFGTLGLIGLGSALWNVALSQTARVATFSGAIFGLLFFISRSVFSMALHADLAFESVWLVPFVLGGALGGLVLQKVVAANRERLGLKDPVQERQELLRQLVDLQERLREGEQSLTFLSLDIVGSTKMKEVADPLSVEFTFTEYHKFVEYAAHKFGGRVHSTAGDGVTCAFSDPQAAYQSARFIQAGLVELNTLRNKIGVPIQLRAGIHSGAVVAPHGQDVTKINFAHVIDVASHLQKLSPPGGIAVSEAAAAQLVGGPRAVSDHVVEAEGYRMYVWQQRRIVPEAVSEHEGPPLSTPPKAPPFELGPST
ncbi:MAG: adenylate/guanylate cyclase domain-containing protein [Fimbriimonadaceae bacterium]|nr:MAG: adenylate/guanylate cyclase domain-containing protein [Fimbriimonadaceae bacterium]